MYGNLCACFLTVSMSIYLRYRERSGECNRDRGVKHGLQRELSSVLMVYTVCATYLDMWPLVCELSVQGISCQIFLCGSCLICKMCFTRLVMFACSLLVCVCCGNGLIERHQVEHTDRTF